MGEQFQSAMVALLQMCQILSCFVQAFPKADRRNGIRKKTYLDQIVARSSFPINHLLCVIFLNIILHL